MGRTPPRGGWRASPQPPLFLQFGAIRCEGQRIAARPISRRAGLESACFIVVTLTPGRAAVMVLKDAALSAALQAGRARTADVRGVAGLPYQPSVTAPIRCRPAGDGGRAPRRLLRQLELLPVDADTADADDRGSPAAVRRDCRAGEVKAALILPVSASGNAGIAGQAMRNAAEMALAEFDASPMSSFSVKDDAGNTYAARQGAQQALDEGAAIILGPLFAQSVSAVGQVARARNVPVIAFSTDANVASRRLYSRAFFRNRMSRASCNMRARPGSAPMARSSPTIRMAQWSKRRSGRMSRAAADRWSRSNATRTTRRAWPGRSRTSRRRRRGSTRSSFPTAGMFCPTWSKR